MSGQAGYAAVVLAGGGGRRLGGPGKPEVLVAGRPMLHRVLAAVAGAQPRVVVGGPELALPAGVVRTREEPPGGGPAAATAAGLALLPASIGYVALLAADLPLFTAAALNRLRRTLAAADHLDGVVYVDDAGRPQWLCGWWRAAPLLARRTAARPGMPIRRLLDGLPVGQLPAGPGPPPYWDCDTEADLAVAREWAGKSADRKEPAGDDPG